MSPREQSTTPLRGLHLRCTRRFVCTDDTSVEGPYRGQRSKTNSATYALNQFLLRQTMILVLTGMVFRDLAQSECCPPQLRHCSPRFLLAAPKNQCQKSHSNVDAILSLSEVNCSRVRVNVGGNLVDSR